MQDWGVRAALAAAIMIGVLAMPGKPPPMAAGAGPPAILQR
jgi:hypothetical protein